MYQERWRGGAGGVRGAKKRHFLYDALDFYNVSFVYILKSIDFNPLKSLHLVLSYFVLFSYRSFPSFWWRWDFWQQKGTSKGFELLVPDSTRRAEGRGDVHSRKPQTISPISPLHPTSHFLSPKSLTRSSIGRALRKLRNHIVLVQRKRDTGLTFFSSIKHSSILMNTRFYYLFLGENVWAFCGSFYF